MWNPDGTWPVRAWIAPRRAFADVLGLGRGPVVAVDQPGADRPAAPVDEVRPVGHWPVSPIARTSPGRPRRPPRDADEVAQRADRGRAPGPAVLLGPALAR